MDYLLAITMYLNCKVYFNHDFCRHYLAILLLCLCGLVITPSEAENNHPGSLQPLQLEITTHLGDGQSFRKGDPIRFMISLDKDAYVTLFYQDASDEITQILPNQHQASSFFKAGLFIPFPDQNMNFDFTAQPPFGKDRVWAFASDVPITTLKGQALANGLMRIPKSIDEIRSVVKQHSKAFYDEAELTINIPEQ